MALSSAPSVASRGVGLSAMVLSGRRLLINRSPGQLVSVRKVSDEVCLPTCFRQASVVAAGAELVHRQGVEVDVRSRDRRAPARLGTTSSRHCTKKKQYQTKEAKEAVHKQYTEKPFLPQALSEKTDAPELGVCILQVSMANGCFGSVPAREMQFLFVNHSLLTQTVINLPLNERLLERH